MTLLLREVARFLVEAAVWVGLQGAVAAGPAWVAARLGTAISAHRLLGYAFIGGAVAAALTVRLSLPMAWAPDVGGRPLPLAWSLAGAVIGTGLAVRAVRPEPDA